MKYRLIKYAILFTLLSLFAVSCTKDDNLGLEKGKGLLKIDLSQGQEEDFVVKSSASQPVFSVEIKNFDSNVIVWSIDDFSQHEGGAIKLKAAKYVVTARNGVDSDAAFDNPFYIGSDTITVESGRSVTSNIICTMGNVKVSVEFDRSVLDNFVSYDVTVSNGEEGSLSFSKSDNTLDRIGFLKWTGSLIWTLNLENNSGETFTISKTISDVQPRDYYKLRFNVGSSSDSNQGGVDSDIVVDESTNAKYIDIDISLNKKPLPEFVGQGFDIANELMVELGTQEIGILSISSQTGITSVKMSHNNSTILSTGIPYNVDLNDVDASLSSSINQAGILWTGYQEGVLTFDLDFRVLLSKLPLGSYSIKITVIDKQAQLVEKELRVLVVPDVEVTTISVDPWAKFAYVYAKYNTTSQPVGMGFKFKKASDQSWTTIYNVEVSGINYSAKIENLEPYTQYEVRAVSAEDESNILSFTTEDTAQLPNMSFDNWIKNGKHWYPSQDLGANFVWDSGNEGANTLSEKNPTFPESEVLAVTGTGKKAVRMESISVLGVLAAGNVFTGDFLGTSGTTARVSFGRPFTSRPIALEGYYSYIPKAIDKAKDPYKGELGKMDHCQVRVVLADWSAPWVVNTADGNFINVDTDPNVIAYGVLEDNTNTNGYKHFTLTLTYKNNRTPKYCMISAAASRYGDYFTGGVGSLMYVDEFSFVY